MMKIRFTESTVSLGPMIRKAIPAPALDTETAFSVLCRPCFENEPDLQNDGVTPLGQPSLH